MRSPNRRQFLQISAATVAAFITHGTVNTRPLRAQALRPTEGESRPPNVVFVFSDSHRWQSMSFTDMPGLQTPNMARMASQGLSMHNTISNFPICSPYRGMLMTGRWPYQQRMLDGSPGMIDNDRLLSPDQDTLGRAFQSAGYRTGYIGKWHLGNYSAIPFGFDLSIVWPRSDDHWNSYYPTASGPVKYEGYNAIGMADQAINFIEANQAAPFFLMVSINPPHQIFTDAPQEWQSLYLDPATLPLRPNVDMHDAPESFWEEYRGYHAHISAVDHQLGRIMQRLDDLGLTNDTILVYTSDHGSMFMSHGEWNKRKPWEESIRVPFLIQWPGRIPAGTISDALFGTIDHMPTLLGLAGLPIPEACSGVDLSPHFLGRHMQTPEAQFIMGMPTWPVSWRGVRTRQYTLAIQHPNRGVPDLLYDNLYDPYQLENRFADPGLAGLRRELTWELAGFLEAADDPVGWDIRPSYLPHLASHT